MRLPLGERILLPHQFYYPILDLDDRWRESTARSYRAAVESPPDADSQSALVYLHIPFCRSRCSFCPFDTSGACDALNFRGYVDAVKREVAFYAQTSAVQGMRKTGLYIGGGTPVLLPPDLFVELVTYVRESLAIDGPTATEVAVGALDGPRLDALDELGISRVSFGIQTFREDIRQSLAISTTILEAYEFFDLLKDRGLAVFVDLMYGLPGLGVEEALEDVQEALAMQPDGIDYMQLYPYGAPIETPIRQGLLSVPSGDECLDMLRGATRLFEEAGYLQESRYTFSPCGADNAIDHAYFGAPEGDCLPGACLGLGPSAMGWFNGIAYRNHWHDEYLSRAASGPPLLHLAVLTEEQRRRRPLVLFPSRLSVGRSCLEPRLTDGDRRMIDALLDYSYLQQDEHRVRLTPEGRLWIDNITYELLDPDSKARLAPRIWRG